MFVPRLPYSLFQKQRLILRRLLRHAKGLEGCSRRHRMEPSGTSFEAASRRLRTREPAFGSDSYTVAAGLTLAARRGQGLRWGSGRACRRRVVEAVGLEVVEASRLDDIREQREDVANLVGEVSHEFVAPEVFLAEDIQTGVVDRLSQFVVLVFPIFPISHA